MQAMSGTRAGLRGFRDVQRFIDAHSDIFRRQGAVLGCRQRYKDGYLGLYYRVAFRQHGRLCCLYLGTSAALADRVREYLQQLQGWRSTKRQLKELRIHAWSQLRRQKKECDKQLQDAGFYLQGFEVRGWSSQT